ncbi:FAD-binding oxidoreductase [Bacillus sp. Bva_UNVM-123]|uniref:FAD-binding oxidoreductase n=1 Tax=Bacillus sp. Bva_UNVM-123 TaxID=2829798 RepID=UPI00391FBD16
MQTTEILTDLKNLIDEDRLEELSGISHPLGNCGDVKVSPYTEEEIAAILKYANRNGLTVSIIGGGTKRGFGGQNEKADILLSMSQYTGVVEHTVGDMTLTVKSGTPFKVIQDCLAAYNQKIPLDPFWPQHATIGGIIAVNDSGPRRLGYGSARDAVIGLKVVYPDGTIIRAGGKVVKNVAGYDMNKLFIGSMGTLGVLSEVTIKLRPIAKYESLLLLSFPKGSVEEIRRFAIEVLDSSLEPVCLELLNSSMSKAMTGEKKTSLVISFEDVESSVRYQEEWIRKITPPSANLTILHKDEIKRFWETFYQKSPNGASELISYETNAALKLGVVNLDIIKIIQESEAIQDLYNVLIEAHGGLGHGLCQVNITGASENVVSAITTLRELAVNLGGYAVAKHLPFFLRKEVSVWGEKPSSYFLFEGIKAKVDPNKLLNPNRFVGGI